MDTEDIQFSVNLWDKALHSQVVAARELPWTQSNYRFLKRTLNFPSSHSASSSGSTVTVTLCFAKQP